MLDCYEEISVGPTRCPIFVTRDVREPRNLVAGACNWLYRLRFTSSRRNAPRPLSTRGRLIGAVQ